MNRYDDKPLILQNMKELKVCAIIYSAGSVFYFFKAAIQFCIDGITS